MPVDLQLPVSDPELQTLIASVAARCLNRAPETIAADTPLALLGLDSLGAIEVGAALEDALGVEIPPEIMTESLDLRALAAAVQETRAAGTRCDDRVRALDLMRADAILPPDVRPSVSPVASGFSRTCQSGGLLAARRVLLTGATGFLGSRLVADMLGQSEAELVCLVRRGGTSPEDRLRVALAQWGTELDAHASRVRLIDGDLSRPRLGLDEQAFAEAADGADAVLHAGAAVNWVGSYATLRDVNVGGTRELLRLACRNGAPFHFVSTISVCYSTTGPRQADERLDGLAHLAGMHLGYAQTKIVAEALVREAARRGLPATIYRPSLISGDSRTGIFNRDDLLSLMIKGTIEMGAAPDLDWMLDTQPVDVVSQQILQLSTRPGGVAHLVHHRPRHWRECLLWMRLSGYEVQLIPYPAWLRLLDERTRPGVPDRSALAPLRTFFLERVPTADGLTRPELYEESRRTKAVAKQTRSWLDASTTSPSLDAALLDRYFDAFSASDHIPQRPARSRRLPPCVIDEAFFSSLLSAEGPTTAVRRAELLETGSEHSIVSELTAWRTGRAAGLLRYRLHLACGEARDVIVKIKPPDDDVIAVGAALAALCDERVGGAYDRWKDRLGLAASHLREPAIYAMQEPRFARHLPAFIGCAVDPDTGTRVLVIEQIHDAILMNSVMRPSAWTTSHLDIAIDGLAALQAVWYGRTNALVGQPWIGWVHSTTSMCEMVDLWDALATHAAPSFERCAGAEIVSRHRRAIDSIARWWPELERSPRTLIHHDFNPRNICLRSTGAGLRLCAYDWELATVGAPERDLAELLCFVLMPDAAGSVIDHLIDRHRAALEREADVRIGPADSRRRFRAALRDLLINRLSMYALIDRVKRQTFLPRVLATWRRLDDHLSGQKEVE